MHVERGSTVCPISEPLSVHNILRKASGISYSHRHFSESESLSPETSLPVVRLHQVCGAVPSEIWVPGVTALAWVRVDGVRLRTFRRFFRFVLLFQRRGSRRGEGDGRRSHLLLPASSLSFLLRHRHYSFLERLATGGERGGAENGVARSPLMLHGSFRAREQLPHLPGCTTGRRT